VNQARDDAEMVADIGENPEDAVHLNKASGAKGNGGGNRKVIPLEQLTRFTMVKRIW
jgi:hypothetical protein